MGPLLACLYALVRIGPIWVGPYGLGRMGPSQMGPILACYLGPTWVSYGRAHMGKLVYIPHWPNMGLLSRPHMGTLWAFPYGLVHMISG